MEGFNPNRVAEYFAPDGRMAASIPGYRYRQEQVRLSESIASAFIDREFLVSEAGTGVGKTYAYLVPAILWAQEQKEKVIISTRTRALQQQLSEKDIPDIKKVLGSEFIFVEAKGRENFLCWNKYMRITAGRKRLEPDEQRFIEAILRWAENTKSGDRKELTLDSSLMSKWGIVAADRKSCLRDSCPYSDKCFRLKMLKSLEKADIIVTNHALLLSDMLVENSILPKYSYLIIDEAHTFDREAFDHLSLRFSLADINETLQLIFTRDKQGEHGYLQYLRKKYSAFSSLFTEIVDLSDSSSRILQDFFNILKRGLLEKDYSYARVLQWQDREAKWLNQAMDLYLDWQNSINLLISKLNSLNDEIKEVEESNELETILQSLYEYSDTAAVIMEENIDQQDKITWLECERGQVVAVASSALDAGQVLNERLYHKLESLVMVSATLAIEESFDYFLARSGLNSFNGDERVNTLLQQSPFNYEEQARLFIINDIPEPGERSFAETVAGVLEELFIVMGGQVLVLFTARSQLKDIAAMLRPDCDFNGIKLLVQYEDGEFSHLVDEFIHSSRSVLMGLETFWEGIDLKGEILKCVVIVRLPFRPPADPYCSAADRYCRLQNKNSFQHFMLPDAAVRFKQGTGRLIRSEEDRGFVVVLDSRLERKSYGRVFKNSIPIKDILLLDRKQLPEYIKDFL
ncbi:MAG: helicase C-terminal domain-containing protein [Syntrophomonadaceae bacterium]|nr:helicase C-terminal domain-containing protein [Syntrophomonadaceae bacterium]MDD4561582.1 helicase C-terminal domain-containing protein [Syntrophomonadaceae bacterium]